MSKPGSDRGRQTESHRAGAAGSDQPVRLLHVIILSCPHLVLSYTGRHDGIPLGGFPKVADHFGRIQLAVVGPGHDVTFVGLGAPFGDLLAPFIVIVFVHHGDQIGEHGF